MLGLQLKYGAGSSGKGVVSWKKREMTDAPSNGRGIGGGFSDEGPQRVDLHHVPTPKADPKEGHFNGRQPPALCRGLHW